MREMAAIEALKSEKGEKEVSCSECCVCVAIDVLGCGQRELQQLTDTSGASGHQKLRVCDVCGAYLSVLDSDRRLADHFGGKVCRMNGGNDLKMMSRVDRCIWATTSCATCCLNSGKSERSARWRLRRRGERVGLHGEESG